MSNLSQTASSALFTTSTAHNATAFTTGGTSTDRYTLNSVVLDIANSGSGQLDVSIHNANGSNPGTKIGNNLTGTIDSDAGQTTYTASGITLNGGTTYLVQVSGAASLVSRRVSTTASNAETGTTGWTIADTGRGTINFGTSWGSTTNGRSLRFTVNSNSR